MKPVDFDYHAPRTVSGALALLARYGRDAQVLAGGQSLVQLMNMRSRQPAHVIDVNGLNELATVDKRDGELHLGSLVRQATLECSPLVAESCPLLAETVSYIGSPQVRNRGTVGGSLAYASPSAEIPTAAVALDAEIILSSQRGQRAVAAADFFVGPFTTVIEPDELLTEVRLPLPDERTGWSFREVSRRVNDLPIAAAAAVLRLSDDLTIRSLRLALAGVGSTPLRCLQAERDLVGAAVPDDGFTVAAKRAVVELDPPSDMHAPGEYRKALAEVLVVHTLREATERARRHGESADGPARVDDGANTDR